MGNHDFLHSVAQYIFKAFANASSTISSGNGKKDFDEEIEKANINWVSMTKIIFNWSDHDKHSGSKAFAYLQCKRIRTCNVETFFDVAKTTIGLEKKVLIANLKTKMGQKNIMISNKYSMC